MWRHCMKDRGRVIGQVDRNQENSKDLGKPGVSRITVINQVRAKTFRSVFKAHKSIIDTDSNGENASPVLKSSKMRNVMKKLPAFLLWRRFSTPVIKSYRGDWPTIGQTARDYADTFDNARILMAEKLRKPNCKETRALPGLSKPLKIITLRKRKGLLYAKI
ncbi:hypothetical protein TNCV_3010981 [Trichonephila clavipes]|nr:hypothetical protein TNCV_3010981 [Trichonephila clavipes]